VCVCVCVKLTAHLRLVPKYGAALSFSPYRCTAYFWSKYRGHFSF